MKITHLDIQNFRGIETASLKFHDRLNIFIGENGAGKSTILNCLAILISRLTWRIIYQKNSGRFFTEEDVKHGEKETKNTVTISNKSEIYSWTAGRSISRDAKPALFKQEDLKTIVSEINQEFNSEALANVPLFAFYSTNRSVLDVPLRIRTQHKFDQIAALENSLLGKREESDFKLFFEWFRNREDIENESFRQHSLETSEAGKSDNNFLDPQLQAVRSAIQRLMPEFKHLQVRRKPSLRMVVMKGDEEFCIEELSDGEKCLLALVADMARRIAMANPSMKNPLEAEAVFLIDEIELHLHPSWQRMIIPRLLEVFPNCQFFITTHSPQVLGEVRDPQSIWIMKPGQELYHPSRVYGLDSNEILSELMETEERSLNVQKRLENIDRLINDEKFDEARQAIRELAKETRGIPAVLGANATLTMLGEEQADLENL